MRQLEPDSAFYGQAYEKYGLFGAGVPTVMAHCVQSPPEERALLSKNGVLMAHCPDANANLASGIADVRAMKDEAWTLRWDLILRADARFLF